MIIKSNIITDLEIKSVHDLHKLKPFIEDSTLKVNKSQIARDLNVDRKTVDKYINGFTKSETRNTKNCLHDFYDLIDDLLSDNNVQVFYYKRVLWQYLKDNHGYNGSYTNFVKAIRKEPEFEAYFAKRKPHNPTQATLRFETAMGQQAQVDWKESIDFILDTGEMITINIFVYLLAYSRIRLYRLTTSKSQDILFSFLDDSFETLGGVPHEILFDNMKTVMDESRTEYHAGKVNARFQQFADDYGFKVRPCIAYRPRTKAKVEAPMKILDEIRAYNGKLDYKGVHNKIEEINNRVNMEVNQGTGMIPIMAFQKEKTFLCPTPRGAIRKSYQINSHTVKVNLSSMFQCRNSQYSVPPEYVGKTITYQIYDRYIHVYYNTKFITAHELSENKLNYHMEHYEEVARRSSSFKEENIRDVASQNLKIIGAMYQNG